MPLPFNKHLDLKLLDLVKENPILYNTKHSKYLDFDSREVVWQKIGDALSRPASEFAGIQCQIQLGDYQEDKHKPGFIENLKEYLPENYASSWGIEKKMLKAFSKHQGHSPLEAKNLYIKTARDLPTYGVTFFLVKEKQKDKKKLVPRLLGINAEAILRLDENTKEILQQWPLTHVKTYHVGKSETFTLNFGDYSDKEYSCKTQDAYRIRDILEGYIDIIRRRMLARPCADPGDSMAICHDNIQTGQMHIIQHGSHQPSKLFQETFVGPSKIISYSQGSSAQQGTQIITMQQMIKSNQMNNPQHAMKGEVAVRGDLSSDCVRKLKRMNSSSVKIVTLLTDPTEGHLKDTQKLVASMQDDLVVVEMGVKATAKEQSIEESKKLLLDEMQDLTNYMNKLSKATKPGYVDASEAKDAAEKIADLTTEMFFTQDPKTRRRSELLNRSKNSFIAGEKMDESIRRASFITSATNASTGIDQAKRYLDMEYVDSLDEHQVRGLNFDLQDKLGKLNAALALYLTAHSDPENIDYAAAVKSMDDIAKLSPELALDAQKLASTKDAAGRAEMLKDMRTLFNGVKDLCSLTGTDDHEKMQEASNNYADVANKLLFTFSRGKNADKENEIIDLAKDAGAKTSLLLMTANELTQLAPNDPASGDVDKAGVKSAGAARDLLACAQLTAPAIHEPHCQSALTAAAEGLSSSVHRLSNTWKPLVEDPNRKLLGEQLHQREMDVHKALERLKDAYANLSASDMGDETMPLKERQRLKFIHSLVGAKNNLGDLHCNWDTSDGGASSKKGAGPNLVLELKQKEAQRRLPQQMAQLNAAVAALAVATADADNPDYATAELALTTISELLPQIVKDMEVVGSKQDESTRNALQHYIAELCGATKEMFANVDHLDGLGDSAMKFSAASRKLVFLISPGADKGKEKTVDEVSTAVYDDAAPLVALAHRLKGEVGGAAAAELGDCAARTDRAARALLTVSKATASTIDEARCSSALASAAENLRRCIDELTATCQPHLTPGSHEYQTMHDERKRLQDSVNQLLALCNVGSGYSGEVTAAPTEKQQKQRMQFIKSVAGAKKRLEDAEKQMKESSNKPSSNKPDAGAVNVVREAKQQDARRRLPLHLDQLNAAIAALVMATQDPVDVKYDAAETAVNNISELLPQIVNDVELANIEGEDKRKQTQQQLAELCAAANQMMDDYEDLLDNSRSTVRISNASKDLKYLINPEANNSNVAAIKGNFVVIEDSETDLCNVAASIIEKLSGHEGMEMQTKLADARRHWDTLSTIASITEPSIGDPQCKEHVRAAADNVIKSVKDLVNTSQPHLEAGSEEQLRMQKSQGYLHHSLNKVLNVWNITPSEVDPITLRREQESEAKKKQRLEFKRSMDEAKKRIDEAEQQLKEPLACSLMKPEDAGRARQQLEDSVAQLNAATAALVAASLSDYRGSYAEAEQAVDSITELIPKVVQDACVASSTMVGDSQDDLIQQARALCDAARDLCTNANDPEGLKEAADKYSKTSDKLVFLVSPVKDYKKENHIMNLSLSAYTCASDLMNRAEPFIGEDFSFELLEVIHNDEDAAEALLTITQVTARTLNSPACIAAVESAVEKVRAASKKIPPLCRASKQEAEELQASLQRLEDSLDKLLEASRVERKLPISMGLDERNKESNEYQISTSATEAIIEDAKKQLKQPIVASTSSEHDPSALQRQLAAELGQLYADVGTVIISGGMVGRDFPSAIKGVSNINTLIPKVVEDAIKLSARKDGPGQQVMLQQVDHMLNAIRAVVSMGLLPRWLTEAVGPQGHAYTELVDTVSPTANHEWDQKIKDLVITSCDRMIDLLRAVQDNTRQRFEEINKDLRIWQDATAETAQGLLTASKVIACTMGSPYCQATMLSAVEALRGAATQYALIASTLVEPAVYKQIQEKNKDLDKSLENVLAACRAAQYDSPGALALVTPNRQDRQRLQFVKTLDGTKASFDDVEKQLKQPVSKSVLPQNEVNSLEHQLSDKLAQLNAAVAQLAAARADREYTDYVSAERAVNSINTLMPQLVKDVRTLSSTKEGAAQQALLQQTQQLCDATKDLCKYETMEQALSDASVKYADASSKLMSTVSDSADPGKEQQIIDLSADSGLRASELLSHVHALTQQVARGTATQLDQRGATTADAAQALLNVAKVTASSMGSARCQASLELAVETLRGSAADLTAASILHVKTDDQKQQLLSSRKELDKSLDALLQACRIAQHGYMGTVSPVDREHQRVQFIRSVSTASEHLDHAEKELKEPLVCARVRPVDPAAAHDALRRRLAQLSANVAALAEATSDYKQPDYPMAERSIIAITELMPMVVQESKAFSCTRDDNDQKLIQENLNELYDASRHMCNNANDPQKLNEAAAVFAEKSAKLVALMSPGEDITATHVHSLKGPGPVAPKPGRKPGPAVPARGSKTVAQAVSSRDSCTTQDFLDNLRSEEHSARVVATEDKRKSLMDEDRKQFALAADTADEQMQRAKEYLQQLDKTPSTPSANVDAVEIANREQNIEDTIARAGMQVAALVSANYADKLDYKAALQPTLSLSQSVNKIVDDGAVISHYMPDQERKQFLNDMLGLCDVTSNICEAARKDNEKLPTAAVSFGNQSTKLLRAIAANVNPALEKEVISRAKVVGDCASKLAQEVNTIANSDAGDADTQRRVHSVCGAGAACVDAAGKLVYTAKLAAPTIQHESCREALISSANTLSAHMAEFSKTLEPLASNPQTQQLTREARNLEQALAKLLKDLKMGRLGRKKEFEGPIDLESPLKQQTLQIMDNAKKMAEHGELSSEVKQEYLNYCSKLSDALRDLDLANARCQRAPHDKGRRNELEMIVQDVQMTTLMMRPAKAGEQLSNIVDFRDFLQGLVTDSENLSATADKHQAATTKRVADDIKLLCSKIRDDAARLIDPAQCRGGGDSFDDIMEIHEFGQECDSLVHELNATVRSIPDHKARTALQAKLLHLTENCYLLKFATTSAISTAKSVAFETALQDLENFERTTIKSLVDRHNEKQAKVQQDQVVCAAAPVALAQRSRLLLVEAAARAARGEPQALRPALASCALQAAAASITVVDTCTRTEQPQQDASFNMSQYLIQMSRQVLNNAVSSSRRNAVWQSPEPWDTNATAIIQQINETSRLFERKPAVEVLKEGDTDKLFVCQRQKFEGTRSQLEDKFHQLSTKLSTMSGSIFQSVKKPESLARSLNATIDSAAQLAQIARELKDPKRPVQSRKIEDASHDMCVATYALVKTSEMLSENPNHHDSRRKLRDACHHLNDAINKLNRAVRPTATLSRDCDELLRTMQLQRSALMSAPQPAAASPYVHCVEALQSQRDVLNKLNNDQAMAREEFMKDMLFVTTAISNSTECAAHSTYLLSLSDKDREAVLEGLVDVPKMHKAIAAIHDTCVRIVVNPSEQLNEEKTILEKQVEELLHDLEDASQKTKNEEIKSALRKCIKELEFSSKAFYKAVNVGKPENVIVSLALGLEDDVRSASHVLEHPALVPAAGDPTPATQALCDDVVKHSTSLVSSTHDLIKEVKLTPEQSTVMNWSSYNKRREVLAAFDALLKIIKVSGQEVKVLEADMDESEQSKSYLQKQTEVAFKWLHKPMAKSDVKAKGQEAVKNLIDVGNKVCEDLAGADKEDMRHLVDETEQLFTHCCKKYDQEQYSLLMERIRELQKAIERMVVTRVVEEFMDAEEPLADLDILADAQRDEKSRKFLLERKIAELLAQLGRVTRTARIIADTGSGGAHASSNLLTCSQQTELLAPMLVRAAEERIHKPDDQVAIQNYRNLLAKYTESLSKVRDLCDQSVDPMDFVQTAGETMQKMREDSTKHNDPMKCAYTSAAITKLANRVINVGLSSSTARSDPELQRTLTEAQQQLTAATPPPDTRSSRMPDWKDTTAKILRATEEVESALGGENIFKKQPDTNQPIYNEALNLHVAIRDWSSRDNEIVAVAKRMAVLMAKLSDFMNTDKQREVLTTSKAIVAESHEVARLAKKLAHECTDHRIKTNLLQVCERIPTISGQLKMLTTVKGSSLGHHGTEEDKEAMDMLVGNAQSLMISIQDVVKAAASASVKIMSQRGPRIKWVRKTYY